MFDEDWAAPTLKEVPFWREGMFPEEYEEERAYMIQNWNTVIKGQYAPLWKRQQEQLDADQKFFFFIQKWAEERKCTFEAESCDGRESPELIDGMAVDDVWGWLLPEGVSEREDEYYGCLEWEVQEGKLQLRWKADS